MEHGGIIYGFRNYLRRNCNSMDNLQTKTMEKDEQATIVARTISFLTYVAIPVVMGTIVNWARNVVRGERPPWRIQVALFFGALAIGSAVHTITEGWKYEYMAMFICGGLSKEIMDFLYLEVADIVRSGIRNWMKETLKNKGKNK